VHNISLRRCIEWAYEVSPNQLIGPAWPDDVRFGIMTANDDQLHLMLKTLPADRFGLKEEQMYALTAAKGGPKFHESGGAARDTSRFVESGATGPSRFEEDKTGAFARGLDGRCCEDDFAAAGACGGG
jgi:uncharacterized protein (TIGR03435 family)